MANTNNIAKHFAQVLLGAIENQVAPPNQYSALENLLEMLNGYSASLQAMELRTGLTARQAKQANTLASLTGWLENLCPHCGRVELPLQTGCQSACPNCGK